MTVQITVRHEAAVIRGVTVRTINRWVESDLVHFVETEDGLLLVCVNSLSQKVVPEPKCEVEYGPLTEAINLTPNV